MAMTASDSPKGLRARLLEHLEDVYTDWHARGVTTGIEPRTAGGTVRFPPPLAGSEPVSAGGRLVDLLRVLERQFKAKPVVLIDEYDAPLTHLLGRNMTRSRTSRSSANSSACSNTKRISFTLFSSRASAALPT